MGCRGESKGKEEKGHEKGEEKEERVSEVGGRCTAALGGKKKGRGRGSSPFSNRNVLTGRRG